MLSFDPPLQTNLERQCRFSLVYAFFVIYILLGFYFYELLGLDFIDEALELGLLAIGTIYLFENRFLRPSKVFYIWLFACVFYLFYSFIIHSNTAQAIIIDLLVQIKPYVGFFIFYYLGVLFSKEKKKYLKFLLLGLIVLSILVGVVGFLTGKLTFLLMTLYSHPSRYSSSLLLLALTFLFVSDWNKRTLLLFVFFMSFALLSGKSKTFGWYVAILYVLMLKYFHIRIQLNFKTILLLVLCVALILFVSWEKFFFYFVDVNNDDKDALARPLLYLTSFRIFADYFPFGSGLASFATAASGSHYSNIYYEYELDGIWGLQSSNPAFVTDTYYPSLAQYGVVGVILFVSFFYMIIKNVNEYKAKEHLFKYYFIVVSILLFFSIEFVADATFTNNKGFYCMMLIALCMNEMRYENRLEKNNNHIDR